MTREEHDSMIEKMRECVSSADFAVLGKERECPGEFENKYLWGYNDGVKYAIDKIMHAYPEMFTRKEFMYVFGLHMEEV